MSSFFEEELYRIGKASKQFGISISTIRNRIYSRKLNSLRTAGGEYRIFESEIRRVLVFPIEKKKTILYSIVSILGEKKDLETQKLLLEHYAVKNGHKNFLKLRDIASGLNGKRSGLNRLFNLINNNEVDTIIVNYKDRLTRFGFDYLGSYFKSHGASITVLNLEEI